MVKCLFKYMRGPELILGAEKKFPGLRIRDCFSYMRRFLGYFLIAVVKYASQNHFREKGLCWLTVPDGKVHGSRQRRQSSRSRSLGGDTASTKGGKG